MGRRDGHACRVLLPSCLAFVLALAAGCTSDPGVVSERADRIATAPAVDDTAPDDTPPDETAPDDTSPDDTGPDDTRPEDTSTDDTRPDDTRPGGSGPVGDTGDGVGDEAFPSLGNPGIDVEHYDVEIGYDPATDAIDGTVTLTLLPTESRAEFTLDSAGPDVSKVTVDGVAAEFAEEKVELRITPASPLVEGSPVDVVVEYTATPDSGSSIAGLPNGWFHTEKGSYALNEPDGARAWLPSNDHPSDKATYTFTIRVPKGLTGVANGDLVSMTSEKDADVWVWEEAQPMATYLIQLLTGDYEIVEGEGPGGLPLVSVVLREDREVMQPYLDTIDDQIDFFDDFFGPFPLDRYGIAMSDSFSGLAMETQGRALFSRDDFSGELGYIEELLLSHEVSHMWFGDAVTPAEWGDIWLNEGFATYAQWMWLEHVGKGSLSAAADGALQAKHSFGSGSTGEPDVEDLFGFNSYDGGALVLHALRLTIGDEQFFPLLARWVEDNLGESRRTEDFIALAEEATGRDLTEFFDDWLFAEVPPAEFP